MYPSLPYNNLDYTTESVLLEWNVQASTYLTEEIPFKQTRTFYNYTVLALCKSRNINSYMYDYVSVCSYLKLKRFYEF